MLALAPEVTSGLHREAMRGPSTGREACGFILGLTARDVVIGLEMATVRNRARADREFVISAHDHDAVCEIAGTRGLAIVAIYHTHLGESASPSAMDLAALAHSDVPWVIVARSGDRFLIAAHAQRTGAPLAMRAPTEAERTPALPAGPRERPSCSAPARIVSETSRLATC